MFKEIVKNCYIQITFFIVFLSLGIAGCSAKLAEIDPQTHTNTVQKAGLDSTNKTETNNGVDLSKKLEFSPKKYDSDNPTNGNGNQIISGTSAGTVFIVGFFCVSGIILSFIIYKTVILYTKSKEKITPFEERMVSVLESLRDKQDEIVAIQQKMEANSSQFFLLLQEIKSENQMLKSAILKDLQNNDKHQDK